MPQMSPMDWLIMLFYFLIIYYMFLLFIFYYSSFKYDYDLGGQIYKDSFKIKWY